MEDEYANEEAKWRLSLMRPWDQGSEVYLHSIYSLVSVTLTPLNLIPIRVTAPMSQAPARLIPSGISNPQSPAWGRML